MTQKPIFYLIFNFTFIFCQAKTLKTYSKSLQDSIPSPSVTYSFNLFELPLQYPTFYSTNQNHYTLQTLLARNLYDNTNSNANGLLQVVLLPTVLIPVQSFQSYQSSLVYANLSGRLNRFAFNFPDIKITGIDNNSLDNLLKTSPPLLNRIYSSGIESNWQTLRLLETQLALGQQHLQIQKYNLWARFIVSYSFHLESIVPFASYSENTGSEKEQRLAYNPVFL